MKDKEKQIFDKYGNYAFPTELKQDGLNVATSQIKEILSIAKIVDKKCDYIKCKNCDILDNYTDEQLKGLYCSEIKIAENIYNAGYRKLPKDSVVLTREEYENIYEQAEQNVLANIADGGTSCHWCIEQHEKIGYEKGSKETAEKIFYKLKETLIINNEENTEFFDYNYTLETIDEIAKQFGVEIKE